VEKRERLRVWSDGEKRKRGMSEHESRPISPLFPLLRGLLSRLAQCSLSELVESAAAPACIESLAAMLLPEGRSCDSGASRKTSRSPVRLAFS
jgi:hypothetical protein